MKGGEHTFFKSTSQKFLVKSLVLCAFFSIVGIIETVNKECEFRIGIKFAALEESYHTCEFFPIIRE